LSPEITGEEDIIHPAGYKSYASLSGTTQGLLKQTLVASRCVS